MEKDCIEIPAGNIFSGSVQIPGSKSLTNRAIMLAALAKGESRLKGLIHCDDSRHLIDTWKKLGVSINITGNEASIIGCEGKISSYAKDLYIENSGTSARFLSAALNLGQGGYRLTGNARMHERPMAELITAINEVGGNITDENGTSCLPVIINAKGLLGGELKMSGEVSSQFISAMMMAAPYAKKDVSIGIEKTLVSRSYVKMTQEIMKSFSVETFWDQNLIKIPSGQCYKACSYDIEGDASSASYFLAAAAITGGGIQVGGLKNTEMQGDLKLIDILEKMGCKVKWQNDSLSLKGGPLKAVDVDMNTLSDVAPTLAVVALFAKGTTVIRNVENMRFKECDRISAVCTELKKLGAKVDERKDGFSVEGNSPLQGQKIETYNDHRMAMSFAVAGLKIPQLKIKNPSCVSKTFPEFFDLFLPLAKNT